MLRLCIMQWCKYSAIIIFSSVLYCEFLADYIPLWYCQWPLIASKSMNTSNTYKKPLKAMVLADIHLLGPIKGHWLDKFYREWHMRGAFQAAVNLHRPDVIFMLGDLFDEGDLVNHKYFKEYVERFRRYFHTPKEIPVICAAGNHDIGFHYKMLNSQFIRRFKKYFQNVGVQLYTIRDIHFVVINSMAMENDGCHICDQAKSDLLKVAENLNLLKNVKNFNYTKTVGKHKVYSAPIVMQHFPTYRISDSICKEHDSPYVEPYRENWEVLSKNATDWLGEILQPRLAFAGHSHNYCRLINRWNIEEYTLASFNWRNKVEPSFLMVTLTPINYAVLKCDMLKQQTILRAYMLAFSFFVLVTIWFLIKRFLKNILLFVKMKQ